MQGISNITTNELHVWDKLSILVGEERNEGQYVARIEEIINGGIIITYPEFVSGSTLLRNGRPVVVQFVREDAAYQFHSRLRAQGTKAARRFILTPPRVLRRVQRRLFARVDFPGRVQYSVLPAGAEWKNWEKNPCWIETRSMNMSAGGLLMASQDDLRKGMLLALQIEDLSRADLPTDFLAVCRRVFSSESRRFAGLEFILVSDLGRHLTRGDIIRLHDKYKLFDKRLQDRLVNFLFHKQIELRQKGLI